MSNNIEQKKRWISTTSAQCMVLAAFVFLAVFVLGSEVDIPEDEARMLIGEFEGQFVGIQWYDIFVHNLTIALGMFIPFGGFVWGSTSALMTGIAFAAYSITSPDVINFSPLLLFITPFGMMELAAYSIAMGTSLQLSIRLVKRLRHQVEWKENGPKILAKTLLTRISIVVLLLTIGGFIEYEILENMVEIIGVLQG